ncbi:hypothetical protein QBC47DRAFT_366462 [Echria macrotheca]|uniref:Uncharacterized protein n=1 Tax=Echria macrotheca TaxID=438768 RepID=A0AAJ0FAI4_9PEZI|nr:hypothetical protein QBC47DRAFT_366462 [Echria macrotheca]
MALTNFPRPAIQTAGRRSGKPLAHPFTVTGVDGSEPTARSTARQTETEDFPTITTGTDTEAPTDMPDMWSTSDCDTDSESITTTGSATAMGSFNPYSFSFSDEKSSFPATNTITDDWSTYTDSISLETNTWVSDATDTATEEATPTAITIPVESSETVIVKMASTTYTIIDGLTQTGDEGEPTTLVPLPLTDLSSATHHRFTSDWPISGHTVSGPWATPFGTETGIWSNSSVVLPTRSAASILGTGVTPASAATATTTDDSDEGGYVTTWAWTPSDDTALPEATEPIPEKKRRRRKRTGSPHRHQQQLAVAEGCSTNTPCLRAMMERRNAVKARGFCHQVLAREQLHDILGAMPVFMQSACREERQGAEAAAIRTACSCLLG